MANKPSAPNSLHLLSVESAAFEHTKGSNSPVDLVSLQQAADYLRVSRTTLWRFRKKHQVRKLLGRQIAVQDLHRALVEEQQAKHM